MLFAATLVLSGCNAPEVTPDSAVWTDTSSVGWWYDAEAADVSSAVWDASTAVATWQEVLDGGLPTCGDVIANWLGWFAHDAGGACLGADPGALANDLGCTSDDGYWFRGVTDYRYSTDETTGRFDHVINLDVDLYGPDGTAAALQGSCGFAGAVGAPGRWDHSLAGTYVDGYDDGWLGGGVSGMWSSSLDIDPAGAQTLSLRGGIGLGDRWLILDDLQASAAGCTSGAARLRDPSGGWYVLDFGAAGDTGSSGSATGCDSCGALSFAGDPAGEACLDWTTLVAEQAEQFLVQEPWE